MDEIIYAIRVADLEYIGLKILDVKIGKTTNIKSTLSQYKRSSRGVEILDLWESNLSKSLSQCEEGVHKIAEKYCYEREGEKFIFLQGSYKNFAENISLLLKKISEKETVSRKKGIKRTGYKRDGYIGDKPDLLKFQGQSYKVNTWREVLEKIARQICISEKDFSPALKLRGRKRVYFSKSRENLFKPRKIEGTPYFFEANLSANSIMGIINKLLNIFGYKKSDLQVTKH